MGSIQRIWGIFVFFLVFVFSLSLDGYASVYLQGQVQFNNEAYTGSASVSLSCRGSGWIYSSDWTQTNSNGEYEFESSDDFYNPCSSTYSSYSWSSCEVYAYQWGNSSASSSTSYESVSIDCAQTQEKNLQFISKDETIEVTLSAGGTPVTEGMDVSCSQNSSPWGYAWIDESTEGVYVLNSTPGTYTCYAYCDWTYWNNQGSSCPYSNFSQATVTVTDGGDAATAALTASVKDKTIRIAVTAGSEEVTDGMTVSCSQQASPWGYSSTSEASDAGLYEILVTEGTYYCSSYCNTWPCSYSGNPSTYVTVNSSDTTVDAELAYQVKDKDIHVQLYAGDGAIISGMSVSCYQQGGAWDYVSDYESSNGIYELDVGTGTYMCSAYCLNWNSCDATGYPQATVVVEESDNEPIDVTLTFLENDATLSGIVTDGSSGLANIWVSINAYQISGQTSASVSANVVKAATVSGGTASSTQVYASAQTNSSGAFTTTLPAGTYTVSVYPPWDRQDLAATSQEVTVSSNQTTSVSLVMQEKTSQITGRVTDGDGNGIQAYINGNSYSGSTYTGDYFWTETADDGTYTVYAVEGRTYNVTASANTWDGSNTDICNYSNEGMQAVTATSGSQTLNFTFPTCDCSMTVNAVDSNGNIISTVSGSVDATPTSFGSGDYFYGIWGWLQSGTGIVKVQEGTEYSFNVWFYDSDYVGDSEEIGTCSDGVGSVNITMAPIIENAVSGAYVDGDGDAVDLSDTGYISVYATKGKMYRSCTATTSSFSCDLSEGEWMLGYWINPASGWASASSGTTTSTVTVSSSGTVAQNITLLKTGTIQVTVLDLDGSGRSNVTVQANPYSSAQEGANDYQRNFGSGWCQTDANGQCNLNVSAAAGSGTVYYVNAHVPNSMKIDESLNNPEEQAVTVVANQTSSVSLSFKEPDGSTLITVTEDEVAASISLKSVRALIVGAGRSKAPTPLKAVVNADESASSSPVAYSTIDCFSPQGGSFETTADESGQATVPCTTDDTWYCVAHKKVANAIYLSEATSVTCTAEGGTGTLAVDHVATVPESKSMTVTDASTQSVSIELSDGTSFFFPQGSLGDADETVTVNVDITITPFTSNKIPASFYAYSVYAFDENNVAITQLNSPATFTLAFNNTQVENMGLTTGDIEPSYYDDSAGTYTQINNSTINGSTDTISFSQNHLTDFAVVGNGFLGAVQGDDGGAIGEGDDEGSSGSAGSGGGCSLLPSTEGKSAVFLIMIFFGGVVVLIRWNKNEV